VLGWVVLLFVLLSVGADNNVQVRRGFQSQWTGVLHSNNVVVGGLESVGHHGIAILGQLDGIAVRFDSHDRAAVAKVPDFTAVAAECSDLQCDRITRLDAECRPEGGVGDCPAAIGTASPTATTNTM
jgi:hypothetical protein